MNTIIDGTAKESRSELAKDELIYTRISSELKARLSVEAGNRGEAESVIVREALNQYFRRHEALAETAAMPLPAPTPAAPVNYRLARKHRK